MQTPNNSLQIRKDSFYADDLHIEKSSRPKSKPSDEDCVFSKHFSDHMLVVEHSAELGGWLSPKIVPYAPISILPCSHVLHYGSACFEGMKAYYCEKDGSMRLFRPEMNMARLKQSVARLCLPDFSEQQLLECIKQLLILDKEWLPKFKGSSLYLRPFVYDDTSTLALTPPSSSKLLVIMSPSAPYFSSGITPVKVFLDEKNVRAWPGGAGQFKLASNYAPTILPQVEAVKKGQGSMTLFCLPQGNNPDDAIISEFAGANVFFLFQQKDSPKMELVTLPLNGTILPGVTRDSILQLCRGWDEVQVTERDVSVGELKKASEESLLMEAFLSGTAVTVVPVVEIVRENGEVLKTQKGANVEGTLAKRIYDSLVEIQYGLVDHPWSVAVV
eukprot:TRINITY_DN11301_c0_g1_i2.p2 TRINITY_DN11301_c0_g1~~TRINITY_DN11301_c0_g1_i2.p2  ORF type:complete len:387 (-),score=67.84 TRINITY_DN11301_c0_g1_i2:169-1329(-)